MKPRISGQAADGRLDRLIDEELRAVAQAPPVNLRAKVLRALDEGGPVRRSDVESGFSRILRPRWALAFAAAAVLVIAAFVAWRGDVRPAPESVAVNRPSLTSSPLATGTTVEPAARVAPGVPDAIRVRRRVRVPAWGPEPVPVEASISMEPYLPGAPSGELGDPLRPMPSPPPIAFAAIASAPPVSEFARPVTDFPADDNTVPAVPSGTTGQSGGNRR